ncbi:cell surface glycoprotein MUC18 isoform 2-T2 [Discoglossus pictus]
MMDLLLLLPLCLLCWRGVLGQQDVAMPQVVEVKDGDTARIPCTLPSSESSNLQWLAGKNGQKIYTRGPHGDTMADSELKNRVNVEEDFTLVIDRTSVQDEMVYICQEEDASVASSVQLKVYKAPEQPEMKLNDQILVNDAGAEIGQCESKNGHPAPVITWYKNDVPLRHDQDQVVINSQVTQESSGLFSMSSALFMPVQETDSSAVFYCEVSYQLLGKSYMMESKTGNFTTLYPNKKLTLSKKSPPGEVKEGDTVELICRGDGNPQPETTLFQENDDTGVTGPVLILENINRKQSGSYRCTGIDFNDFDLELEAETEILVHYLDKPQIYAESPKIVKFGDNVNVLCTANGSAQAEIQWESDGVVIGDGPYLELNDVNFDMSGRYTCIAEFPNVPGLSASTELQILVEGPPELSVNPKNIPVQKDDVVEVTCKARGHPIPDIVWSINGTVKESKYEYGVISGLTFLVSPELINMAITCEASNSMGTVQEVIQLEEGSLKPEVSATVTDTSVINTTEESMKGPMTEDTSNINTTEESIKKEQTSAGSHGVVIVVVIVCILLLAILGAVLYFLYKTGRIPCGRSGKQDITSPGEKDQIVVEMKPDSPAEESVLLPESQEKKPPGDQGEKYMDLRN